MTAPSPIQVYIHVRAFQNGGKFSYSFDRYLTKCSLKNNHKFGLFYRLIFGEVCPKHSRERAAKLADFSANLPLKIPRNLTFFPYLSEAQHSMARSIRFENIM